MKNMKHNQHQCRAAQFKQVKVNERHISDQLDSRLQKSPSPRFCVTTTSVKK